MRITTTARLKSILLAFAHSREALLRALICLGILSAAASPAPAQAPGELIKNGGFEGGGGSDGRGAGIPHWSAFQLGYEVDRTVFHKGEQSARCDSLRSDSQHGVEQEILLNQARPAPIVVSGCSKADQVDGSKGPDYSIYVDLEYTDGTPLWGQIAPFRTGTHDWERRQTLIVPVKPVRKMTLIGLFRKHTGTVWFDDFSANQMAGAGIFDGQPLLPLPQRQSSASGRTLAISGEDKLGLTFDYEGSIVGVISNSIPAASGTAGGFWVRDVAASDAPVAMKGRAFRRPDGGVGIESASEAARLRLAARIYPDKGALAADGDVTDTSGTDRAVTVYLTIPVAAEGWMWGGGSRFGQPILRNSECSNLTHVNVGATSGMSLYPVGCVYNQHAGMGISNQMAMPEVFRIFYNAPARQFVIAWDFALTGKTNSWPKHQAHFHCSIFQLDPRTARWGFRAALERFYAINSPNFNRLAKADGTWMPFTSPETVPNYQDFGFAYHEGDNSKKADNAAGILNFRYTEPMTWWMPMPPGMPRTYENAMKMVTDYAAKNENITAGTPRPTNGELAKAVLNCGTQDEGGRFNLEFRNEPWANGAVFVLDPNPEISSSAGRPTRAYLNYNAQQAKQMYGPEGSRANGVQDGEYLDSLEGWSDVLDFRPENLAASPYPLTFETDSRSVTMPQWFSTHAFTRYLSEDLHNRSKLLMANSVPIRFSIYAAVLDVMGIEVNWLDANGKYAPDSDDTMLMRRQLSAAKPYLLMMNTNFDKFGPAMVESYFKSSMFYGIFPGMFSADAANQPYFETPKWYERDRPLFKRYVPIIKRLSAAGWEPVTEAVSSKQDIYVERFGSRLFTLLNASRTAASSELTIDLPAVKAEVASRAIDLVTGAALPAWRSGNSLTVTVSLAPGDSTAIEIK